MIPLKVTVPGSQLKVSSMFPFSSKSLLRYLINTHAIPDLKLCSYRRDREQRFFFSKLYSLKIIYFCFIAVLLKGFTEYNRVCCDRKRNGSIPGNP